MATILTPSMALPIPSVGTEQGPDYATDINNCLTLVDAHDHSPGYGTPVSPAGMNINADLSFLSHNATQLRTVRFTSQASAPALPSDLGCLYEVGNDLYFTDGLGNSIRITQSGAVAGTPGSIANLTSPASASYSSAAKTFTFQSAALTPANIDAASYIFRNLTPSSFGLTLQPPTLSSDVAITLPQLPASTLPLSISTSGVMSASQITLAQLAAAVQTAIAEGQTAYSAITPPGAILMYGGTTAPTGYLMCEGQAVSRTTYAALYAAIGDSNGAGNGSTTFNVPDARGRFIRGVDGSAGRDPDSASRSAANTGGNTGNNVGSVQTDQVGPHSHTFPVSAFTGNTAQVATGQAFAANYPTSSNGTSETRPINLYSNFIIKV